MDSRLKPWLRTTDGLWWLAVAYKNKQESKLAQSRQFISYAKSNNENSNDAIHELALEKYTLCPKKFPPLNSL